MLLEPKHVLPAVWGVVTAFMVAGGSAVASSGHGAGHGSPAKAKAGHGGGGGHGATPGHGSGHGGHEAEPEVHRTDLLDLGDFDLRTTLLVQQDIVRFEFSVQVLLPPKSTAQDFEQLSQWKRRLRDQVITAVRTAEPEDFADSQLTRLRRFILLRIRRLPLPVPIAGVYISDFAIDKK